MGQDGFKGNTGFGSPFVGSIADVWKAEAARDLGIAPADLVFMIIGEGGSAQGSGLASNGGTRVVSTNGRFGQRLASAGGANGMSNLQFQPFASGVMVQATSSATDKWWMKARFGVNMGSGGPVGAATVLGGIYKSVGGVSATRELAMGVYGPVSQTNFVVSGATGGNIDSGVVIDSLVRDHKVYRDGASTYYAIDGGSPLSGSSRPSADSTATMVAFDSAAVNQAVDFFLFAVAFPVRALGA